MSATISFNTWNHSATWGLPPSLPEQITGAAAAGYDWIGLDIPSLLAHENDGCSPHRIREYQDQFQLPCFELVPLTVTEDAALTAEGLAHAKRFAPIVGAQQVLTVVRGAPNTTVLANVRRCVSELAALGISMAVEFLPTIEVNSITTACQILDVIDRPELRVMVDSWHFFAGPDEWDALEALPQGQLGFVQFSDAEPTVSDDVRHEYLHRRSLPGDGTHDVKGFAERVLRRWPDVVVSVEVLSSTWRARPVGEFTDATLRATRPYWQGSWQSCPSSNRWPPKRPSMP